MLQVNVHIAAGHNENKYLSEIETVLKDAFARCKIQGTINARFIGRKMNPSTTCIRLAGGTPGQQDIHIRICLSNRDAGAFTFSVRPPQGMSFDDFSRALEPLRGRNGSVAGDKTPVPSTAAVPANGAMAQAQQTPLPRGDSVHDFLRGKRLPDLSDEELELILAQGQEERDTLIHSFEEVDGKLRALTETHRTVDEERQRAKAILDEIQERLSAIGRERTVCQTERTRQDKVLQGAKGLVTALEQELARRQRANHEAKLAEMAAFMEAEGISPLEFAEYLRREAAKPMAAQASATAPMSPATTADAKV